MTLLRRRVQFASDEALVGFASRLAACNGVGLNEFCRDMGLPLRDVVHGDGGAVDVLARLTGEDPSRLGQGAIVMSAGGCRDLIRGESVDRSGLRRTDMVVCPRCLVGDLGAGSAPPRERARARLAWCVRGVETCPIHRVSLSRLDDEAEREVAHDFSLRLGPHLPRLPGLAADATERDPTGFERYLIGRLDAAAGDVSLLDAMPFHAACDACLRVGMLAAFGPDQRRDDLGPDRRRDAEAAGFDVLSRGAAALIRVVDAARSKAGDSRRVTETPGAGLGRFWTWLSDVCMDPGHATIVELMVEHGFSRCPLPDGARILGVTLARRRWHSVRTAAAEHRLSANRVRNILSRTGMLARDGVRADDRVLLEAERVDPLLADLGKPLGSLQAASRLAVSQEALGSLVEGGHIGFVPHPTSAGTQRWQCEPAEADDLVARAFGRAVVLDSTPEGALDASACAAELRFPVGTVLRLALDDETLWRGRLARVQGLAAMLLRPRDVEERLRLEADQPLKADELAKALRIHVQTVRALVSEGHMVSRTLPKPLFGRAWRVVDRAQSDAFSAEFASLQTLALEMGSTLDALRHRVAIAGVRPTFAPPQFRSAVYRRQDVSRGLSDDATNTRTVSVSEVARRLRVPVQVVSALIERGLLSSRLVPNWSGPGTRHMILPSDVETFATTFASPGTLASELGMAVADVRFALAAAGVGPAASGGGDHQAIYRREDAAVLGSGDVPSSRALGLACAAKASGLDRATMDALVEGRVVEGRTMPSLATGEPITLVAEDELATIVSIAALAHEQNRDVDDVRAWLAEAGVAPVEVGGRGIDHVFRRADLPHHVTEVSPSRMLRFNDVVRKLGICASGVAALVDAGALPSRSVPRTARGKPMRGFSEGDVDAFAAEFVTLGELARARGATARATAVWLTLADVRPAFEHGRHKVVIYRRASVPSGAGAGDVGGDVLNLGAVASRLRVKLPVARSILAAGAIRSRIVHAYGARRSDYAVSGPDLAAFAAEYASLGTLAREQGVTSHEMRSRLASGGRAPAFGRKAHGVDLYRRADASPPRAFAASSTDALASEEVA